MAWKEENIHVHVHINNDEVVRELKEIKEILKGNSNDEKLKQQIMDKLNNAIQDIKSTIQ